MRMLMNIWPPFLGAGIRVRRLQPDWKEIDVEMKLRRWNSNYVGTHYGGSLYSMTDPFFMLMLIENLGREYIVWDKAATIRFRKPGKGKVSATFRLSDEHIEEIRQALETQGKVDREFTVEIRMNLVLSLLKCRSCCMCEEKQLLATSFELLTERGSRLHHSRPETARS
jgi:hypothetical protein